MKIKLYLCLVCILMSVSGCSKSNPQAEKAAIDAAQTWLALVDSQQYTQSWEQAAEFFKNAVPMEKWEQSMNNFRAPLGKLKSREVKSSSYRTALPGAPDGQYVIIQFKSSFENKASAVETVTPMLDKDGSWKVSGYYIK